MNKEMPPDEEGGISKFSKQEPAALPFFRQVEIHRRHILAGFEGEERLQATVPRDSHKALESAQLY